jgi:hypothetical protein
MSTTATDSPKLSGSPSPSEVVAAIETAAEELAALIDARFTTLLREGSAGWRRSHDIAAFDGLVPGWLEFVESEVIPRLVATHELGQTLAGPGELTAAIGGPAPPGVNEEAWRWALNSAGRFTDLGKEVQAKLPGVLADAVAQGADPRTLAATLREQFGLSEQASMTMARTELMAAFTNGDRYGAESLPVEDQPVEHTWHATSDNRTRPDHVQANGQTVAFRQPFSVGGWPMMHPHDDAAPSEQVVNCRCVELFLYPGDTRPDGSVIPETPAPTPPPR